MQAELKLGIINIKKKQKSPKRKQKREQFDSDLRKAEEEKERIRLAEIRKKIEREKAWFMSHPHKYLQPRHHSFFLYYTRNFYSLLLKEKKEKMLKFHNFTSKFNEKDYSPPFCVVCKKREYEYWEKEMFDAERNYTETYNKAILKKQLNDLENVLMERIEKEMKKNLMSQAKEIIHKQLVQEGLIKEPIMSEMNESEKSSGLKSKVGTSGNPKAQESLENPGSGGGSLKNEPVDETDSLILSEEEEFQKMAIHLKHSHLPIANCAGENILQTYLKDRKETAEKEKRKKQMLLEKKKKGKNGDVTSNVNSEIPINRDNEDITMVISDVATSFGMETTGKSEYGLKIRVFHRNENGDRAKFLGMIEISEKV